MIPQEFLNKISVRQESNKEIVEILNKIVEDYPEMRFCQILTILSLDRDRFYEESCDTLKKIKECVKNL
jgi:hypothetical protein